MVTFEFDEGLMTMVGEVGKPISTTRGANLAFEMCKRHSKSLLMEFLGESGAEVPDREDDMPRGDEKEGSKGLRMRMGTEAIVGTER